MNGLEQENEALKLEVELVTKTNRDLLNDNDRLKNENRTLKLSRVAEFVHISDIESFVLVNPGLTGKEIAAKMGLRITETLASLQWLNSSQRLRQEYTKKGDVWVPFDWPQKPTY